MHVSSPIQPYLCLHLPNLPSEISQLSWPEDCAGQESPSPHHSLNLPTYLLLLRQADVSWKSSSSSAPLPWLTGPELGSVLACSCPTPSTDWDAASDYQTLPRMGMGLDKGSSHHLGDQNGKGGRQRRAAARATGLAGRDEQTVAALAPRLAPRCSAPFCSRWETFCSVSCNGPNYSEPRSVGTCWQEVTPPCCQPSSHRGCGSRAASGLVRAGRPSGTTGAAATAAQRTRAALHLFRARRLCSLTGLRA
ncbi:uncharacterized protein LOC126635764 isoform X2 [Myiozetetes cayanensis]|nr:uncharacterized protein LOC126635764 isoform X2 [Myiozetetes cayanensis]XP_050163238.1 uncharacterized protein LOC126635764 isoform X2 [Myiozetetes cayanensis]XP_050163239.1 uncharacterized protein LOC126635764 isoform X2 [Myiozetetes cayanensis]